MEDENRDDSDMRLFVLSGPRCRIGASTACGAKVRLSMRSWSACPWRGGPSQRIGCYFWLNLVRRLRVPTVAVSLDSMTRAPHERHGPVGRYSVTDWQK